MDNKTRKIKHEFGKGCSSISDIELLGSEKLKKISILSTVQKLPEGAFRKRLNLIRVYFERNSKLTRIPIQCFSDCSNLEKINLPDSLITIDSKAFLNCTKITSIEIPDTVTFIEPDAFDGWKNGQLIICHHNYTLSPKCLAKVTNDEVLLEPEQRVISKETDLSLKKYLVTVKCGHVTKDYFIPIVFPIMATSKKAAAAIARNIPRVKHDHKDAIISVNPVTDEQYDKQEEINRVDPYLKVKNIQEQRKIDHVIQERRKLEQKRSEKQKSVVSRSTT
jgi:hypothetical protein